MSVQVVAEDIIKESFTDHRLCCIRLSYMRIIVLLSDMAEGLLHVISNASVQWSLFSVKSNYPHKKGTPCVKARQKSQSCLSREALASFQVLHEHRLTFHVKTSSFTVRPKYT